jgi:signal transduction histidine kinase
LQLQPLLNLVLDQLGMVVEYTGAGISVLEGAEMRIAAYRGPGSQVLALDTRLPSASAGPLWEWMRRGEPVIIQDVRADSHEALLYRQSVGGHMNGSFSYVRSWMSVPLRVRDRDLGSVFLEHAQPNVYTPRHAELALAIARQAAIAIDNARLYEQVHEAAALEERQRLARELHDSVSQALYGIGLGATTARALLARDPQQVAAPLDYVITLAKAGLAEMRALIFELLPEALETEGLIAALTKQTAAVQARYGLAVDVMLGEEPEADLPAKQAIYRIAQEALHNVVKHARAGSIVLRLEASAGHLALEVRDDGMGFDAGGSFPGHLGLRSMRERMTRLGGDLSITSAPGAGTTVRATLPTPG